MARWNDRPDGTSDALTAPQNTANLINSLDGYHPVSLVLNCQDYYFKEYTSGRHCSETGVVDVVSLTLPLKVPTSSFRIRTQLESMRLTRPSGILLARRISAIVDATTARAIGRTFRSVLTNSSSARDGWGGNAR